MASAGAAASGPIAARLRGQRRPRNPAPQNAPDPEIEVVHDPENVVVSQPLAVANDALPREQGRPVSGGSAIRASPQREERERARSPRASSPRASQQPVDHDGASPAWVLRAMQEAGITIEELLEQRRLFEELKQMRDAMVTSQKAPAAAVLPPFPLPAMMPSIPGALFPHYPPHPDFSGFKQQPDFTGHDQDLDSYVKKFRARMEAMRMPIENYSRVFIGQLDKAALNFAVSNSLTADTPFDDLIATMKTGPWVREMTDISARRRLSSGLFKRKPVHEIVKNVEDIFNKFPTQPDAAEKIYLLMTNLPDALQDKVEISPTGQPWPDYVAFRTFVLQLGALVKPPTAHPRASEAHHDKRKPSHPQLPGVGPLRIVNRHMRDASVASHSIRQPFNNKFKKYKNSTTFVQSNAGPSGWHHVSSPAKKCLACGQTGHRARDTRDGKTPVCKKYDPSKGALIKVAPKNSKPQR